MSKRIDILNLTLSLALILTACQPLAPSIEETPTPTRRVPTATPENRTPTATNVPQINVDLQQLNGLQITFLHPWADETGRMMDVLVDEFNQSNEWGIHVITREPGSLGLAMQDLEDSDPDEVEINFAVMPTYELLFQDENQRKIVDLNPYVNSTSFGFSNDQLKDFRPVFWNENLIEGKLYGIPAQETASVLFYNTTLAKELGFSQVPLTTTAFRLQNCAANATFRKDNDRSNDGVGGWIINEDAGTLFNWMKAFDALDLTHPVEEFSSAGIDTTFEYLFNLQKDACAWDSRLPEPYDYFATRQALTYSGSIQDILPQSSAFMRSGMADDWEVILYPSKSEPNLITEGLSFGVFESNNEKQLATWLFIRWVSQPENQASLLKTSGSLPLGIEVMSQMTDFKESYPQWNEAVALLPYASTLPVQANSGITRMVLGDAATFLFRSEFTVEQIPALINDLDATIQELRERQP